MKSKRWFRSGPDAHGLNFFAFTAALALLPAVGAQAFETEAAGTIMPRRGTGRVAFGTAVSGKTGAAYWEEVRVRTESEPPPGDVLRFFPGRMNVLEVSPGKEGGGFMDVRLRVTSPQGEETAFVEGLPPGGRAEFELGPMLEPPVYSFERGEVYRRGYGLELEIISRGKEEPVFRADYRQGLNSVAANWRHGQEMPAGPALLIPGGKEWVRFNPLYGVESAVGLRLGKRVLRGQDELAIETRLNPGAPVQEMEGRLVVESEAGDVMWERSAKLDDSEEWSVFQVEAEGWPAGDYRVGFRPLAGGREWGGPSVFYRRREQDAGRIEVSPPAPWTLARDFARDEVVVTDFREIIGEWVEKDEIGRWYVEISGGKGRLVFPAVDPGGGEALKLSPGLEGSYAVFAAAFRDGCVVRLDDMPGGRWVLREEKCFVGIAYPGQHPLVLYPVELNVRAQDLRARTGLAKLRLVPVTEESVHAFRQKTARPKVPLYAVSDWADILHRPLRVHPDQFKVLTGAQGEIGLSVINWSLGRSWSEYHSELSEASVFPVVALEDADHPDPSVFKGRTTFINHLTCPLRTVLESRPETGVEIWPWLMMNRHYGGRNYFSSEWYLSNPQWHRVRKNGDRRSTALSFFFEEVRKVRANVYLEAAELGADGVVVGTSRGAPMLLYHPEMVESYKEKTGVNPLEIDARDGQLYEDWIRWRADHFTEMLRFLRTGLKEMEARTGRDIPLSVRIPSVGLFYNLAQGLDVARWLKEDLVDKLQLNPMENCGGRGVHDVAPYLELAGKHGVPVIGGIGARGRFHTSGFKRALGLIEAGVDGIETYATEYFVEARRQRWLIPLFGSPEILARFLADSNWEGCFPLTESTVMGGYDNSSRWFVQQWSVYGTGSNSL